ncbi:hypothetical protein M0804_000049 [Polistes exclamans]|nr:hypothetical protein M0804_000049 [Polistes exclamans]
MNIRSIQNTVIFHCRESFNITAIRRYLEEEEEEGKGKGKEEEEEEAGAASEEEENDLNAGGNYGTPVDLMWQRALLKNDLQEHLGMPARLIGCLYVLHCTNVENDEEECRLDGVVKGSKDPLVAVVATTTTTTANNNNNNNQNNNNNNNIKAIYQHHHHHQQSSSGSLSIRLVFLLSCIQIHLHHCHWRLCDPPTEILFESWRWHCCQEPLRAKA